MINDDGFSITKYFFVLLRRWDAYVHTRTWKATDSSKPSSSVGRRLARSSFALQVGGTNGEKLCANVSRCSRSGVNSVSEWFFDVCASGINDVMAWTEGSCAYYTYILRVKLLLVCVCLCNVDFFSSVSSQFENDNNLAYCVYFILIHDSQSSTTFTSTFDWTKSFVLLASW